jgi:sn-glycerol 3-phosphate transport system permease protein
VLEFPGKGLVFLVFIATLLVPLEATLVVNYDTVDALGWTNTYAGLAVPFLATAFGTFLIRQVLLTLPGDLRDAARLDGVGHLGYLRHVALPLVRPTLGALALFSFLSAWNQYLWPSLVVNEEDMNTVQSGLRVLGKSNVDQPNLVMAGTIIAAVPVAVVLLVFQRQLVRGLTAGAVKG